MGNSIVDMDVRETLIRYVFFMREIIVIGGKLTIVFISFSSNSSMLNLGCGQFPVHTINVTFGLQQ